jgi:hypothetical protein
LHKDILLRCSEDEVGLWEVVRVVVRDFVRQQPGGWELLDLMYSTNTCDAELGGQLVERERAIDPTLVREQVLHIIDAGFPADHGTWESWNLSPAETMRRIEAEWDALGHPPNIGDIVWFVSTIEGDRVLSQGAERNTAHES